MNGTILIEDIIVLKGKYGLLNISAGLKFTVRGNVLYITGTGSICV